MIRKIRNKFVILTSISVLLLLIIIVTGANFINYRSVIGDADEILALISTNKGTFPGFNKPEPPNSWGDDMSPELPYESRYFSVLIDENGKVIYTDTSKISVVDEDMAKEYAEKAVKNIKNRGFISDFRYLKSFEGSYLRITFLHCKQRMQFFYAFLSASLLISFAGLVLVVLVVSILGKRITRPISESYAKQKSFITDAGHEMKTPLTIINANVDLLEMEYGENESLFDIQQQTKRLTELTNNLVYLAKMEETERTLQMVEFPISEITKEASESFITLAKSKSKRISCNIAEDLSIKGNEKAIMQLLTILLDNAIKYSPENSEVLLSLYQQKNNVVICVKNPTDTEISQKELSRIFDRFYRADSSRNSKTGGHGIGLSIAQAIVSAHNGKISASMERGKVFKISAILPKG